jgi:hypothetical protein
MRFNPLAQSSKPLAPLTVPEGTHYLFDTKPGDIAGTVVNGIVASNFLIVAIERQKGIAESLAASIPSGECERWMPKDSKSWRWTVFVRNVTESTALSLASVVHGSIRSDAEKTRQPDAKRKKRQPDANAAQAAQRDTPRATQHATIERSAVSDATAERVRATSVTTFAFLIGEGCDADQLRGNWRRAWSAWPGRQSFEACVNDTPQAPVIVALATPDPLPTNIIPMPAPRRSAAELLRNLRTVSL